MQVKAIKTFMGRYGLVRTNMVMTLDDRYARSLIARGLVAPFVPELAPDFNAAIPAAPQTKAIEGNVERTTEDDADRPDEAMSSQRSKDDGSQGDSSEEQQDDGSVLRSSSLRRARPSRRRT